MIQNVERTAAIPIALHRDPREALAVEAAAAACVGDGSSADKAFPGYHVVGLWLLRESPGVFRFRV
jgi:uncharacterized protein (UPF0147 family)